MVGLRTHLLKAAVWTVFSMLVLYFAAGCSEQTPSPPTQAEAASPASDEARKLIEACHFAEATKHLEENINGIPKKEVLYLLDVTRSFQYAEKEAQNGDALAAKTAVEKLSPIQSAFPGAYAIIAHKLALKEKNGSWPTDDFLMCKIITEPDGAEIYVNNHNLGKSPAQFVAKRGDSICLETNLPDHLAPMRFPTVKESEIKITLSPFKLEKPSDMEYYQFAQKLVDEADLENAEEFIAQFTREVHPQYGPGMLRSVKELRRAQSLYRENKFDEALKIVADLENMECCAYGEIYGAFAQKIRQAVDLARKNDQ